MKVDEPLLDRAGVYTQLQQLLTPGSSNGVLDLLPPDTRAIWQSLGAAAAAAASKHARAGDTTEVQQEMALQQMQQLLEAAAEGQPVTLEKNEGQENTRLLLNRIMPQVLAHKPFAEEKDYHEESRVILGSPEGWTDGNRCTNKDKVKVALVFDDVEPVESMGADNPPPSAGAAAGKPALSRSSMSDDARLHWRWQQRRVQQLRGRMRRRMCEWGAIKSDEREGEGPDIEGVKQEATNPAGEIVVVGRLAAEGGRRLCWATAILEPMDGSAPVQLLHLQEALQQQHLQLQQWQISRLQRQTPPPDAMLFPGMVVAAKGRLQQDGYGQQLLVSAFHCGLPVPRPVQVVSLEPKSDIVFLDKGDAATRRPSTQLHQQAIDIGSSYRKQNVHVLMASCSFLEPTANGGWMLRRSALNGLLSSIRETLPHVVILFGPIISWLNLQQPDAASRNGLDAASLRCAPLLQVPEFTLAYAEFFRCLITAVQGLRTRVFIVPSTRDTLHPEPMPQPPYTPPAEHQLLHSTIHCVSNPCTIQINDTRLLFSSADPVAEVAGDVLCSISSQTPGQERMQQVCRSLLKQRTLFPRGVSPRTPLDAAQMKPLMFDDENIPHIIAFPSVALPQQQDAGNTGACVCAVDGRLFVSPFNPQNRLEDGFDFTSLYIHPAASPDGSHEASEGVDMKLAERVTVKYSVRRPRKSQNIGGS